MDWIDDLAGETAAEMEQVVPLGGDIPQREELGGYVTVARAAHLSGLSDRWLRRLCKRRELNCIYVSDIILIEKRSLLRYAARHGRTGNRGDGDPPDEHDSTNAADSAQ